MEKEKEGGFVYIISDGCGGFKVGVSVNPEKRLKTMQTGNRKTLILEHYEHKLKPYKVEKVVHQSLAKYRTKGEWFEECTLRDIRIALMLCTEYD